MSDLETVLLEGLEDEQKLAVKSDKRRLLLIAGAGSGKTEVMARRVAWWLASAGVPKDRIVAFTFTDRAAEEMKFRIRKYIELITPAGEDTTLGGMYVGTIHSYCLKQLREIDPTEYHNYDVIDEISRYALVKRQFHNLLGLPALKAAYSVGTRYPASEQQTIERFLKAYDILNEYNELDVVLADTPRPTRLGRDEADWCKAAKMRPRLGSSEAAQAFAVSAARFYAYLRCRRFLDFSTSQSEVVRLLLSNEVALTTLRGRVTHLVVDEVQDINPVQDKLIKLLVGATGHLTAVGDHRQAIFGWRGGRVELMADLAKELKQSDEGAVLELTNNFRSTARVIRVSNEWNRSIGVPPSLSSPDMAHGRRSREDYDPSHTASLSFATRDDEAAWIATTVQKLVNAGSSKGATQDTPGGVRGLTLSDIAILLRTTGDARVYMSALRSAGIPSVVRAGPDLFAQPEVLLMAGALAISAGMEKFLGGSLPTSLPSRVQTVLGCAAEPAEVVRAAVKVLDTEGIPLNVDVATRLTAASELLRERISGGHRIDAKRLASVKSADLRTFLRTGPEPLRRVFPQMLYHLLLAEAGVDQWDASHGRGATAMFHLGQLSSLVTGIETPGWTSAKEYPFQVSGLLQWGSQHGRTEEAPLLVSPDAVQISTIHSAKGLEFAAVFLADVCSSRFPSSKAKIPPNLPFDGPFAERIDATSLADNANRDGERRLMYVALTRAERYLFVTSARPSEYFTRKKKTAAPGVTEILLGEGGAGGALSSAVPGNLRFAASHANREKRLVTSFSDLRYYLECPHDFYLRKVLGFAPTIDQAFGYGRGIHNLLREVHSDAKSWSGIAGDADELRTRLEALVRGGLFYLRHTVGDPAENMRRKAVQSVSEYVETYQEELARLEFEPEREFETLFEEEQVLVSGAIDVVRLDDPPRVTIIDFKSGEPESDDRMSLDEDEMRLQVTMYGLAARHELEYEPDRGLVRYLGASDGQQRELAVDLDDQALQRARNVVVKTARSVRDRKFHAGPTRGPRGSGSQTRCDECDFLNICGMDGAVAARRPSSRAGRKG